jgi:gluconate 2-dehydrogenase gamma chain
MDEDASCIFPVGCPVDRTNDLGTSVRVEQMPQPKPSDPDGETASAPTAGAADRPGERKPDGYTEALRRGYSRRQVLRFGVAAVIIPSVLLEACGGGGSSSTTTVAGKQPQQMTLDEVLGLDDKAVTFDPAELQTVQAVLERLIPTDSEGPGAREAKVWRYIDRALSGAYAELKPLYTANLAALDRYSASKGGGKFAARSPKAQEAILGEVEADKAKGFTPSSEAFFQTVRQHALEGMYGDPYHGGNAEFVGWNLIGFPGILDVNPVAYQKLGVTVPQAERSVAQFDGMFTLDTKESGARSMGNMGTDGNAGELKGA